MLRAEAAALLLLLSRRKKRSSKGSLDSIAAQVAKQVSFAIRESRIVSSLRGIKSLVRELESLGINTGALTIRTAHEATLLESALQARKVGARYGALWRSKAVGSTVTEAARAADTATNGALKRIGVTESSNAFGSGKKALAEKVRAPTLYRVYDAVLDKRTCPTCAGSDGQIVGLRERFRSGEPGTIHPNCRCTWSLLSEQEINGGYLIQAA